jgi:Ca-activated chloride channel family protein
MNWQTMDFQNPEFLRYGWALAALVLLGLLGHARRRRRLAAFIGGRDAARRLSHSNLYRLPLGRIALLCGATLALAAAAAGPGESNEPSAPIEPEPGRSAVIAIDISASMQATDLTPNRLANATTLVRELIGSMEGDRVGLLLFAGSGYPLATPSDDHAALEYLLTGVTPTIASAHDPGSLLSVGIEGARALLDRAEAIAPAGERLIFLIADGGAGEPRANVLSAARAASAAGITLHTIGVGTSAGSEIVMPTAPFQLGGRIVDDAGRPVISRIEEDLLEEIAAGGGGTYLNIENRTGIERLLERLAPLPTPPPAPAESLEPIWMRYDPVFWFIAAALLLLRLESLLDVRLPRRRGALLRRPAWS